MAYEEKPGSTTTPSVGGEYNDDGSSGISSYPIQYEGSDGEGGYQINPGATGNLSAGGEYDNLDTADSLSYTNLAAQSAGEAALSAAQAATSVTQAASSAASAVISAANAATSATNAANSATAAGISATNSANSATSASASAATATTKAAEASTSATNAANSATSSAASAATATTQATNAAASATIATTKASEAATSATNSADSATASANSATSSANSATTATTKAAEAVVSANSAASSATSAGVSATSASNSASAASTSETNAATSAANSLSSATSASNSATSANTSAVNSAASAATATTQAASAATSATTATTKAAEASASASSASSSAATATTKAAEASVSAFNAATSAASASTSASNAATSATSSANSATAAGNSATNAALSASSASTSATNANTSANSAISAQAAAEAARDQALAAFDNFDDKYLGEKTSDPTTDNDGNPLVAGALYFNSVIQGMKVYTGTAWVAAYMSGAGYMLASNNLSELTNLVTARSNLGLGSSALANGYTLDELNDVVVTSVTDGQILEYDSATNTWRNTTINALPSQATHTGQFLTTDGTNAAWASITGLPSQATHAGQYLKTDGTTASWSAFELPTSTYTRTSFTATAGQTTFSVTYTLNSIQVYVNGVLLSTSDYTATNGTSFVLASAANLGDFVEAVVYNTYGLGEVLAENIIGTVAIGSGGTGATTASGARTSLGLGTAATTDSTAYATSAQGTKADSALQPATIGVSVQGYNANTVIDSAYVHTDNNYTTTEKSKLAGIEAGAEVNVNADWNATTGDAAILNKPTLGTMSSQNADNVNITGGSITSGMVTSALGYTPYNSTNPSNYITTAGARSAISVTGAGSYDSATGVINIVGGVTSFNTRTGAISLTSGDVTGALGFTPYNSTNPNGYITGITSGNVTTALGYTPYNSSNPSGYITSSALSSYLPLSGGTMTSTISYSNVVGTKLSFYNTGTDKYGIDVQSNELRIYSGAQGEATGGITFGKHDGTTFTEAARIRNNGTSLFLGLKTISLNHSSVSTTTGSHLRLENPTGTQSILGFTFAGAAKSSLRSDVDGNFILNSNSSNFYWNYDLGASSFNFRNSSGSLFQSVSGTAVSFPGDIRSPIFYDNNNTGYYCDPSGLSNLLRVACGFDSTENNSVSCSNWFRSSGNTGWYNQTYAIGIYAIDSTWVRTYNSANFLSDGIIQGQGSVRAPIFYDSNDTGFYLDPNGTSRLNTMLVGNGAFSDIVMTDDESPNGRKTIHANSNNIGFLSGAGSWIFRVDNNGVALTDGSFRAPIFYDSNDTGFYLDPNGTSLLRNLALSNYNPTALAYPGSLNIGYNTYNYNFLNGTWPSSLTAGILANCADQWEFAIHDSGERVVSPFIFVGGVGNNYILMGRDIGWGATFIQAASSFRAPIFYDSNDTAYYTDPASTSVLNALNVNNSTYIGANLGIGVAPGSTVSGARVELRGGGVWDAAFNWTNIGSGGRTWSVFSTNDSFGQGGGRFLLYNATGGSNGFAVDASNNLTVGGNVTAYGTVSDRRLKHNIREIPTAIKQVLALSPVYYSWNEDTDQHRIAGMTDDLGFIAQDAEEVEPLLVRAGTDGMLGLRERGIIALLTKAFQEQNKEVENLKSEISELKSLINKLIKD